MKLANLKESPLVSVAEEATRPTRWWLGYLFSIIVLLIFVGVLLDSIVGAIFTVEPGSMAAQFNEGVVSVGTILMLALWVRFKEGRPVSSLGFRGSGVLSRLGLGILIGAGMMTLTVLILTILGQYHQVSPPSDTVVGWSAFIPFFVLLLGHWFFQASMEETIFRGYLLQIGALQLPGWLALLLPGLIFSGLHFVTEGLSQPIAGINILVFALLAAFVALRQGSLWMACGIHIGWNWFQGNAFGVPVSGAEPWDVSLFRLAPTDNAAGWLSGGGFGPEASLVVTVVWGIGMLIAYAYFASAARK